eukprot:scaffold23994_cov63-Phaeocystis_antarctica.AAC.1
MKTSTQSNAGGHRPPKNLWAMPMGRGDAHYQAGIAPGEQLRRGHRAAAPDREARAPVASAIAQARAPLSTGVRGAFASGVGVAAALLVIKGLRRQGVIVAFRQRDTPHNHGTARYLWTEMCNRPHSPWRVARI